MTPAAPLTPDDGDPWPPDALADSLAFLLKHTQAHFAAIVEPAFEDLDIDGRELGVLRVLADRDGQSQQQAAGRLAIDRTTMVAFVDRLEDKGLVVRHPHPSDRRVKVVEVTKQGRAAMRRADRVLAQAEQQFLAPLGEQGARRLKQSLLKLIARETQP
jgi:DNA-binding MarR family transcriptional regulator